MNEDPGYDIKTIAAVEWRKENIGRVREKTGAGQVGIYTGYADSDQRGTACADQFEATQKESRDNGNYGYTPKITGITKIAGSSVSENDERGSTPLPLTRASRACSEFPIDALGKDLGAAVRAINGLVKCPVALTVGSVLCAASLATMPHADAIHPVTGRRIPLSLYLLEIGESGERKSESDKLAMYPVTQFSKDLQQAYAEEIVDYETSHRAWELARAEIEKKAKGDGARLKAELENHGPAPMPPLTPSILVDEPTWEAVVKNLASGRPAMALATDEGGSFIGGHAMQADAKLRTIAGMSKLWDGSVITRHRSSEASLYLAGRRLATHLMVQFRVAQILLADSLVSDQGYLARFLISFPESTVGTRFISVDDAMERMPPAVHDYWQKMEDLLRKPAMMEPGTRNTLAPRQIRLSEEARRRWVNFSNGVEAMNSKGATLAPIQAFANKLNEHVIRIAGVMAVFEDPDAREISDDVLKRAIEIGDYFTEELLRINEAGVIPEDIQIAKDLLEWLRNSWTEPLIGLVTIYQRGPHRIRNKRAAKSAVAVLEDHNWLVRAEGTGNRVAGKTVRAAWRVIREAADGAL